MTINLTLPPDLESRLLEYASVTGQDIDRVVIDLVRERLQPSPTNGSDDATVPQEGWSDRFRAWIDGFPPVSHTVDDSRESIYEDR